jgi:Glycosyltransferase family 87
VRPRTIYALAVIGVALYAFPGLVSYDSLVQLDQARTWQLTNWHPPIMALLWRLCEVVVAGPLGMLVLQLAALFAGLALIYAEAFGPRRAAWATLATAWYPPVLVVMAVIWKDSQMAGYLVLAIALLRRGQRWPALVLLVVASALRHNAPPATFAPLVLLFDRRWWIGALVWIAVTAAGLGIDSLLVNTPGPSKADIADLVEVTDIQGIARYAAPISDDELRELLAGTNLKVDRDIQHELAVHYDPPMYIEFAEHPQPLELSTTPEQHAAVQGAWSAMIRRAPLAYLHHRWNLFRRVLDIHAASSPPVFRTADQPSTFQRAASWFVRAIGPLWYVPFIYFVVASSLFGFARTRLEFALLGSGVGYELGMFPAALIGDYRYAHWLILSTVVALVLVIRRRAAGGVAVRS